jgi:hypothetical protein
MLAIPMNTIPVTAKLHIMATVKFYDPLAEELPGDSDCQLKP